MRDVVGAGAYESGRAAHISGIVAKGNRLTLHLSAPVPDLPSRLAMPSFCAVPLETPLDPKGVRVIPSAGPYYVTSYTPERERRARAQPELHRQPSPSPRPDGADHRGPAAERRRQDRGRNRRLRVGRRRSRRRRQTRGALRPREARRRRTAGNGTSSTSSSRSRIIVLNTHRPLFRDVRLRQAVSYAIDRRKLTEIAGDMQPTDQYLPCRACRASRMSTSTPSRRMSPPRGGSPARNDGPPSSTPSQLSCLRATRAGR